jgi:hypothetical protein
MITQFKIFEKWESTHDIIYSCRDFKVNNELGFESMFVASDLIAKLPEIIKHNLPALYDDNFKNIKISDEHKRLFIMHRMDLDDNRIKNTKEHKSGLISEFIICPDYENFLMGKKHYEFVKNINSEVYIQLTLKYYPIIEEAIKNSENIGDLIIEYEKLIPKINKDLELFTQTNKYNL